MIQKTHWLLITCLALFNLTGCHSEYHSDKDVFNWNIHAGITSLDPAFARNQANIWGVHQMFNGLLELDDDLQAVPSIAHSWEVSDDGKTYTFYLRDDVYFHDHEVFENGEGRRVTASDFEFSLNRLMDPEAASPGAWIFRGKIPEKEVNNQNLPADEAFKAIDDTTFQIRLKEPFPPLPGLLTMQYCSVVPEEAIEKYGQDFRNNPVGTGPFKLAFWEEDNRLIMHRNPNYFEEKNGEQLPFLDAVNISFVPNKQNEFFSFIRGDLDILSGADPSFQDNLLTKDGQLSHLFEDQFHKETIPFLNTEYLGILVDETNEIVRNSPLKLKKVRQAINYGFNRKQMMFHLRNSIGQPAHNGMVPQGIGKYDHDRVDGYSYKPEKAQQLLKEAGFDDDNQMPRIELHTTEGYLDLATFIQNQLDDIGIPVEIDVSPPSMHREWVSRTELNFFRASWIADYPDPENYLALFYTPHFTPDGPNYTHFSDDRFDELYEKALSVTDDSARHEIYYEMENIVMEESPVVVLYYDEVVRLTHHHVQGLNRNAINLICLKEVRFTKEEETAYQE